MKSKKTFILLIATVAVLIVCITAVIFITLPNDKNTNDDNPSKTDNNNNNNDDDNNNDNEDTTLEGTNIVYVKDNEIHYLNLDSMFTKQVTENLYETEELYYDSVSTAYLFSQISSDFKYLFYTDHAQTGTDKFPLYRLDLSDKKAKPEKIADSVYSYKINEKGTIVYYSDDVDVGLNSLYKYDFKETEKIVSNIIDYHISSDGSKLLYYDATGVYLKTQSGTEQITDLNLEAMEIHKVTPNLDFYIQINYALYYKQDGKDMTKIVDSVIGIEKIYDTGEIYYKNTDYQLCYYDKKSITVLTSPSWNKISINESSPVISYYEDGNTYVAKGDEKISIDGVVPDVSISSDTAYYFVNYDNGSGELIALNLSSMEKTIIDDGVYKILTVEDNTGKLFYMKSSTAAGTGDLYHDKKKIDSNVSESHLRMVGDKLTYITQTGENMTYKAYDMSEVSTIANKVDTYCISLPEGIAFLKDYYEIGDIYLYDGNQVVKKLVSKVQFFNMSFPVFNYEYEPWF